MSFAPCGLVDDLDQLASGLSDIEVNRGRAAEESVEMQLDVHESAMAETESLPYPVSHEEGAVEHGDLRLAAFLKLSVHVDEDRVVAVVGNGFAVPLVISAKIPGRDVCAGGSFRSGMNHQHDPENLSILFDLFIAGQSSRPLMRQASPCTRLRPRGVERDATTRRRWRRARSAWPLCERARLRQRHRRSRRARMRRSPA